MSGLKLVVVILLGALSILASAAMRAALDEQTERRTRDLEARVEVLEAGERGRESDAGTERKE